MSEKIKVVEKIIFISGLGLLASTLLSAFSRNTRNAIGQRASGYDEVTGRKLTQFEAAHLNHNRNSPEYDDPENGLAVNAITHAWIESVNEDDGLTSAARTWAISQILSRAKPTKEDVEQFGRWLNL